MTRIKQWLCGFIDGHDWVFRTGTYFPRAIVRTYQCSKCRARKRTETPRNLGEHP